MWVEVTKNGKFKFVEQYKNPLTNKNKRVSVTFSKNTNATKKQAQKELEQKIKERLKVITYDTNLTLKTLCEMYITDKKEDLKVTTQITISRSIDALLSKTDQEVLIYKLTPLVINKIVNEINYTDQKRFKMILSWSYKKGIIETDLARLVTPRKDKDKETPRKLFLEKDELEGILEKLRNSKYKTTCLLTEFLTLTGLRIGEAVALTHDDCVDGILTINKTYYRGNIGEAKTKDSVRCIALNKRAMQIIKEMKFYNRIRNIETNLIFPSPKGRHLNTTTFASQLKRIDGDLYPHIFRHTHASLLAEQNVPLEYIQRRLGHSTSKVTKEIYIHITTRQKQKEHNFFKELDIL